MSVKDRLIAKIDLKDALFGGTAIYVSVLLVTYLTMIGADLALRYFNIFGENSELLAQAGTIPESLYGILFAAILAIFLITFFLVVLFDETLFSKHEKGVVDLLGLGLVWGMTFVTLDMLVETMMMYIFMFRNQGSYYPISIRGLLFGFTYWFAVVYITFLPVVIYYLRENHRKHMEKTK